ncbi:TIM barrel protein [Paenibacillus hunanensis]|uniref:TIM barrel protein n=1 Tax=Paenibacillus hunanensis TaxID=539262 RepID=UPI002A6AB59E|nr:TIM barrel protein [Paenibacillus hunanensis]WPP41260.1 TIM barrel protein [Paenibacillus hunanensis]
MNNIRLKSSLDRASLDNRLQYDPEIIELYLRTDDLQQESLIRERIRELKQRGIRVYLHHPSRYDGRYLDIMSTEPGMYRFYRESTQQLVRICQEEGSQCVIHANYLHSDNDEISRERTIALRHEIDEFLSYGRDFLLWEDSTEGLFCYANPYLIDEVIVPLKLPVNVDVSHTFISFRGDNDRLREVLERTAPYAIYYHLVDSMGQFHDSLPLGQGLIDWKMVKSYVQGKEYIFEINLEGGHIDCTPMVESARFFDNLSLEQASL